MASIEALSYDEFVVVAEEQWKIHCDTNNANTKFSTRIGNYEWDCSFRKNRRIDLQCQQMINGIVEEMHIEVIVYYLQNNRYCRLNQDSERILLKGNHGKFFCYLTTLCESVMLIIRILKDRSKFPSLTAPNSIGNFFSDVKLRFGEQIYHVNKQLLSMFSPFFDRMFNGEYKESKQEEIELKVEGLANPKAFEDGLLALCYPGLPGQIEVFPNSQNVADLLVLAQYFQLDLLKEKCERLLEMCSEMDILDRILLAKKFGLKELQDKLVDSTTLEESRRICNALLNAPEQ